MEVICIETEAFYALIENVVERLEKKGSAPQERWVSTDEAMSILNIKSKTTLQKLRDEGKIRFSQPQKKLIAYDRESLQAYLDKNARETF